MSIIRLLIVIGVAGFSYQYWSKHTAQGGTAGTLLSAVRSSSTSPTSGAAAASPGGGFVQLPPFDAGNTAAVIVVAAENCPEEDARRADDLTAQLRSSGIPVARSHNVSFTIPGADQEVAGKVSALMNGQLPIVLVNGKGKANPKLEEVVAEYQAGRR